MKKLSCSDAFRACSHAKSTLVNMTQRECFETVLAGLRLRSYIEGTRFTIPCDHDLKWIGNLWDAFKRFARWRTQLSKLDLDIVYRAGVKLEAADELLRFRAIAEKETHLHDDLPDSSVKITHISSDETHYVQTCRWIPVKLTKILSKRRSQEWVLYDREIDKR